MDDGPLLPAKAHVEVLARWADMWDTCPESLEEWQTTRSILDGHCAAIDRNPLEIRSSIHLGWPADVDPAALAAQAAPYLGIVNLVIFSMRGPYRVELLEPLANELSRL